MKKSHEVLKCMITRCGAKSVAADMGLSQSLIYKWCQPSEGPTDSGADNPLDRLMEICELTGDDSAIDWLCQQTDSFRVKNPVEGDATISSVLDNTQIILKEFSDVLEAVTESYANGHRIDQTESARIRTEWEELKSVAEQFVYACEAGLFEKADNT
jgi:hypothetical protein